MKTNDSTQINKRDKTIRGEMPLSIMDIQFKGKIILGIQLVYI